MPVIPGRPVAALVTLAATLAALFALAAVSAPVAGAAVRACGNLNYDFPNGNGGASAIKIRANGISCRAAIPIVATCLAGEVPPGYRRILPTSSSVRLLLRSGTKRITYAAAGGGC